MDCSSDYYYTVSSINYISSYRTNPHAYPSRADIIKPEQLRRKNLEEQHKLEKIQKEKSLELSFNNINISKHI